MKKVKVTFYKRSLLRTRPLYFENNARAARWPGSVSCHRKLICIKLRVSAHVLIEVKYCQFSLQALLGGAFADPFSFCKNFEGNWEVQKSVIDRDGSQVFGRLHWPRSFTQFKTLHFILFHC